MGLTAEIVDGFRRVKRRLDELVLRMRSQDARIAQLERRMGLDIVADPNALLVAPGSPIHDLHEIAVVQIGEKDNATGAWKAKRRTPDLTAFGKWNADSEDTADVLVRMLPSRGAGTTASDFEDLTPGAHVCVLWQGRTQDGRDLYVALAAVGSGWWGIITNCNPTTGLGKAKRAEGAYPNLSIVSGAEEVDVILGKYPPLLMGFPGLFIPSGSGVSPAWTLVQHIRVAYRETAENLATVQDDGGGLKTACTAVGT